MSLLDPSLLTRRPHLTLLVLVSQCAGEPRQAPSLHCDIPLGPDEFSGKVQRVVLNCSCCTFIQELAKLS